MMSMSRCHSALPPMNITSRNSSSSAHMRAHTHSCSHTHAHTNTGNTNNNIILLDHHFTLTSKIITTGTQNLVTTTTAIVQTSLEEGCLDATSAGRWTMTGKATGTMVTSISTATTITATKEAVGWCYNNAGGADGCAVYGNAEWRVRMRR